MNVCRAFWLSTIAKHREPDRTPAPSLPFEVWACIASFLDWDAIQKLFALNHFFYHHVLDRRYRCVHLDEHVRSQDIRRLQKLGRPSIAARVRTLALHSFPPPPQSRTEVTKMSPLQASEMLNMELMKNLRNLTIVGTFPPPGTISAALTLPPSLRNLTLNCPISLCVAIASTLPSADAFPQLSELSLEISCDCSSRTRGHMPQGEPMLKLLPLLTQSSRTLEKAKLRLCYGSSCAMNATRLCEHLRSSTFTQLRELDISLPSTLRTVDDGRLFAAEAIKALVSTSMPNLTGLTLNTYPALLLTTALPAVPSGQALNSPQLQSLCLCFLGPNKRRTRYDLPVLEPPSTVDQLSGYIFSQQSTLIELDLGNVSLRYSQLKILLEPLRGQGTSLSVLHFTTWRLEPRVFQCLFSWLPRLRSLAITYEGVQPDNYANPHSDPHVRVNEFLLEMNVLCFADWSLEVLKLTPTRHVPYHHWSDWTAILVQVFPTVETVHGAPM